MPTGSHTPGHKRGVNEEAFVIIRVTSHMHAIMESDAQVTGSPGTSTHEKAAIESAIAEAVDDMQLLPLKPKQFEAVFSFMSGSDTFVSLPTGYGKSIIYGILPKAFDFLLGMFLNRILKLLIHFTYKLIFLTDRTGSIAVVVSPLISLMMDQRAKFAPRNLTVEFLGEAQTDRDVIQSVTRGEVQLVFISLESLIDNRRYWNMLQRDVYQSKLIGFIVDEAHCIKLW